MESINKIIENNMGLVYVQLKRFHLTNDDDAYSFAIEALWKAIETYDEAKGYRFSTYASVCIYNALGMYVRQLNSKRKLTVVSYNALVDDSTEFEYFLGDLTSSPETQYLTKELESYLDVIIEEEYAKLSGTARQVIGIWIESEYKCKQSELAKITGTTQSTVSRVLSAFKYKLKRRLEEYQC